jgi:spore maturation protein CgeB
MTKLVLFWAFYPKYLQHFYQQNPQLAALSYQQQRAALLADNFGWPPALMRSLAAQGHDVEILIVNAQPLQQVWAREQGIEFDNNWQFTIPLAQIRKFGPDAIWIGSMFQYFRGSYLAQLKAACQKLFAWIACPIPDNITLEPVDCVITSHANFQAQFLQQGKPSELLLPAFEQNIAAFLQQTPKDIDCSFIGSVTYGHLKRMQVLKRLVKETPITIWSDPPKFLSRGLLSPKFIQGYLSMGAVRQRMQPGVWGMEMYRTLARSKICINVHIDVAAGLAGNMRMFEVTGAGSLLLTENASNLQDLFEPNQEVAVYSSTDELIEKIRYYLAHPQECKAIAAAGQKRTLSCHSTAQRSHGLIEIFHKYL